MLNAILGLLLGLLIGSFLNVCIYRMPKDLSVVRPRSYCPFCKETVSWYDNVPVLSFLLLRGRCRHCEAHIPARYPVVELLTGVLFCIIFASSGLTLLTLKLCVFVALLVALIFTDLEERLLPDEFTLGGAVTGVLLSAVVPFEDGLAIIFLPQSWSLVWISVAESILGAASSLLLWLVGELYFRIRHREGLGFGDVKMVAMIGAFLGLHGALLTVIAGSVLGSALGLGYILLARKQASNYELPFGSFLGIAAICVTLLRFNALEAFGGFSF